MKSRASEPGDAWSSLPAPQDFSLVLGTFLQIVAATLAPIVPLALTMMPLEELLKTLLGVLF
jgi:hypothetical protein